VFPDISSTTTIRSQESALHQNTLGSQPTAHQLVPPKLVACLKIDTSVQEELAQPIKIDGMVTVNDQDQGSCYLETEDMQP
jgi:hypothetical protein